MMLQLFIYNRLHIFRIITVSMAFGGKIQCFLETRLISSFHCSVDYSILRITTVTKLTYIAQQAGRFTAYRKIPYCCTVLYHCCSYHCCSMKEMINRSILGMEERIVHWRQRTYWLTRTDAVYISARCWKPCASSSSLISITKLWLALNRTRPQDRNKNSSMINTSGRAWSSLTA